MPKSTRSKKKTDQKAGYEVHKVERLALYVIGKSCVPLSSYDIEKEVVKQMIGLDKQKYVYEVLNRLVPHNRVPYMLLFQLDDFFNTKDHVKDIDDVEKQEKLIKRIIHNVFRSYPFLLD